MPLTRGTERETRRRLEVDNWPDDSGHRWRRLYFDGLLVDVDCADCHRRPMDLLKTNLAELVPCDPAVEHERFV